MKTNSLQMYVYIFLFSNSFVKLNDLKCGIFSTEQSK